MKFSIDKIIIWPRDTTKSARVVSFRESGINLITGSSRSGKSAIIKIIDYCLGSRTCSIPKLGPIRRSSSWYGVSIHTEEGYKLLAREDPGQQEGTDEYMLLESSTPIQPERPTRNTNRETVLGVLARLSRLPQSTSDFFESGSGYKGRASFGDMTAFIFQPQTILANDKVFFFEAEDEQHARKLREIFPLVLGAVDADTLVQQHRLAEIRRLIERKRRQLETLRQAIQDFAGEIRGRYATARQLGLIDPRLADPDHTDISLLLIRLREVAETWNKGERRPTKNLPFEVANRIAALRERELEVAQEVASIRSRIVQVRELDNARHVAVEGVSRERDRLSPVSHLLSEVSSTGTCPFCGADNYRATEELTKLKDRAALIEAQWRGIASVPPMLDAEEVELRRAQTIEEERLRQLRIEKKQLEQLTEADQDLEEQRAVFLGKLMEFLNVQRMMSDDGSLSVEISSLEQDEAQLRSQVDEDVIEQRKEDALLLISKFAKHYGQLVELEQSDGIIKLDTRMLTIRVLNNHGESAWLSQIGSGANHLGYHVATLLALHEFFVVKPIPYVPSVLVMDQPSQTQFPDEADEEAEREELVAVQKAFQACDSAVERTGRKLQIIVSEHAGKAAYEGLTNLTVVERWRRGRKLIPWHWDAAALTELRGRSAEWALADLREHVLIPALLKALSLRSNEDLIEVRTNEAVFGDQRIDFSVAVSASGGAELTSTTVRGHIAKDLSVAITSTK